MAIGVEIGCNKQSFEFMVRYPSGRIEFIGLWKFLRMVWFLVKNEKSFSLIDGETGKRHSYMFNWKKIDGGMMDGGWIDVNEKMPEKDGYYLVACMGGNVAVSFYVADRNQAIGFFKSIGNGSLYSRRHHGKQSAHFEIAHCHGYKIDYWMHKPKHPKHAE